MKIAVVTGASSGMGHEFALRLAAEKQYEEIWVIARRRERLEELAAEMGGKVRVLAMDLTLNESLEQYAALLKAEQPQVLRLVNCSGFGKFAHHSEVPLSTNLSMIDLNCKALVAMTELTLPYMPEGGKIIQLDSLSAFQPVPYICVYGATKAFVLSYSRAMNAELRSRRIQMMAVCPGWVKTEFFDTAMKEDATAVTHFDRWYTPKQVVDKAMKDLARGRDLCIPGFPVRMQTIGVKLLPTRLIMHIWLKQQGHA